jgi:DNA-directed RNA polymerase specialized sigma24 family protein
MPKNTGSDTQIQTWLDRLIEGNEAAREELIRHASVRLRALARRMLRENPRVRRWEETDDVFQRALLRLHQSLASGNPPAGHDRVPGLIFDNLMNQSRRASRTRRLGGAILHSAS